MMLIFFSSQADIHFWEESVNADYLNNGKNINNKMYKYRLVLAVLNKK